jgi:hypothetical protein
LWANHEVEFLSRLRHNTSTAASSQDTLPLVKCDTPRHLVRSSVGIISYSLLTLFVFFFFFFLSFVGVAPQHDTVPDDGAASTSKTTTADVDRRDQPAPPK